jgi:orotate phosphoribosyltransferase-like protein
MAGKRNYVLTAKQQEALQLRAAGASYGQIASVLGVNKGNAYRMVQRALPARELHDEEVRLDLLRLDQALMAITPQVRAGDLEAVNTMLRLTEVRARIRSKAYEQHQAGVVVQNFNQLSTQGVLVIKGDTKEEYIAGLRQARGELPPPTPNGNGELPAPDTDE